MVYIRAHILDLWSWQKLLCGLIANSKKAFIWEIIFLFTYSNNSQKQIANSMKKLKVSYF